MLPFLDILYRMVSQNAVVQLFSAKQNNNVLVEKLRNLSIYIPVVRFFINLCVFVRKIQFFCLYQFFSDFFCSNSTM